MKDINRLKQEVTYHSWTGKLITKSIVMKDYHSALECLTHTENEVDALTLVVRLQKPDIKFLQEEEKIQLRQMFAPTPSEAREACNNRLSRQTLVESKEYQQRIEAEIKLMTRQPGFMPKLNK